MTFVDTNILIDILSGDERWADWSQEQLARCGSVGPLIINEIVYAEMSARLESRDLADHVVATASLEMRSPNRDSLFLAGQAFRAYRARGGVRTSMIPDFIIGAHASVLGAPILTRDTHRFQSYFPQLPLISPEAQL